MSIDITPFNRSNLYRLDTYTDLQSGQITHHIPVSISGELDPLRISMFIGQTYVPTSRGPMPIQFEIKANTLSEAIDKFSDSVAYTLQTIESKQLQNRLLEGVGQAPSKIIKGN